MVRECDCDRFRTVAKSGAEPWLKLGPESRGLVRQAEGLFGDPDVYGHAYARP